MGTNFTDIATGANANAAVFNAPLDELDTVIENLKNGTTAFTKITLDLATDDLEFIDADEDGGDATQFGSSTLPINGWIKVEIANVTHYIPTTETEP